MDSTAPPRAAARGYLVRIERTLSAGRAGLLPVVVLAVLAAVVRLPFTGAPLSPDEGGFLMVAGQWSPGRSLYGDYWVDRPPLLIGLFQIADHLGGAVGLRVLGLVAVAATVALAGLLGRVAAPGHRWAPVVGAATAAVFLSDPLFGTREVAGELLAGPFVLAGLLAVLRAATATGARALGWWAVAGALAAAALGVKQSMGDVAVAGVAALAWHARSRGWRRTAYAALAAAGGGLVTVGLLLAWAAARGTEPRALWDAVVAFRMQASTVISAEAPGTNAERASGLADNFLMSGAAAVLLLPLLPGPRARRTGCLPLVAGAVCAWEALSVVAGGSYWWHYLIATVPGLVLVALAVLRHRPRLVVPLAAALGYATLVTVGVSVDMEQSSGLTVSQEVASYLTEHAGPHDTGITAFGDPAILRMAGLTSPYEQLWSLPVRVRDPDLAELTGVLDGADRPTWVVTSGPDLSSWGIDASRAQPVLDRRYRLVQVIDDWYVFHVAESAGTLPP